MPLPLQTLADIFIKQNILDEKTVTKLAAKATEGNIDFYTLCLKKSGLEKQQLNEVIARSFNVATVDLTQVQIDPVLVQAIPEIVARKHRTVIFAQNEQGLHVATDNPGDVQFIENYKKRADQQVNIYFADSESIDAVLKIHHTFNTEEFTKLIEAIKSTGPGTKAEDLP